FAGGCVSFMTGTDGMSPRRILFPAALLCAAGLAVALSACSSDRGGSKVQPESGSAAVSTLQRVNTQAATCWMRSKDSAFKSYNLSPKLATGVARPRILVREKTKSQGLPVLVIEAHGQPVKIETYGPLSGSATGARINSDVQRWSSGQNGC